MKTLISNLIIVFALHASFALQAVDSRLSANVLNFNSIQFSLLHARATLFCTGKESAEPLRWPKRNHVVIMYFSNLNIALNTKYKQIAFN